MLLFFPLSLPLRNRSLSIPFLLSLHLHLSQDRRPRLKGKRHSLNDLNLTWPMRLIEEDGRHFVPGKSSLTTLTGWLREVPLEITFSLPPVLFRAETASLVRPFAPSVDC
jgi:hypothetical protein